MRTPPLRNNHFHFFYRRKGFSNALLIAFLLVIIMALPVSPVPGALSKSFGFLIAPLFQFKESLLRGIKRPMLVFRDKETLLKDIASMRERLDEFEAEKKLYEYALLENDELRTALGRDPSFPRSGSSVIILEDDPAAATERKLPQGAVLANVLARPGATIYDTLIIDVGSEDSVSRGDLVLGNAVVALGNVVEVEGRMARVQLFSRDGDTLSSILGARGTEITLTGRGSGNWSGHIPRGAKIRKGDPIWLSGNVRYLLGTVGDLSLRDDSAFAEFLVSSPLNLNDIQIVFVIPNNH